MNKKILLIIIQCVSISLCAQDVPVGQFKEYLSYSRFQYVAQDKDNVYAATDKSIFVLDKRENTKDKWSKLNGLSEIGIQTMLSDQKGRVIVVYGNSNIDIIQNYKVHNVRDILNKQIVGTKTVNSVFIHNDLAYLACDFGVVTIDLQTFLVKDSWFTIRNNETYRVFSTAIHNGRYYIATNRGVFSLSRAALNPADFSTWTQEIELSDSFYIRLCSYQCKLFAVRDNGNKHSLFVLENSVWREDETMNMHFYRSFEVRNEKMLVCDWNHIKIYDGDAYRQFYWSATPPEKWENGQVAIFDEKMNVWVADNSSGLIHIETNTGNTKLFKGKGPINNTTYGLFFYENRLAVVPGERTPGIYPDCTPAGVSIMEHDKWWVNGDFSHLQSAYSFNSVIINPLNKDEIYMASWAGGLFKANIATGESTCYNNSNSILISADHRLNKDDPDSLIFLSGLAVDKQNRLWMAQSEVPDCIKVKELSTGKWHALSLRGAPNSQIMAEHILIDSRNNKWITFPRQSKLIVFSENGGSLANTAVHKTAEVDINSQANVPSNRITCIAEDREGRIWIGANQGVKVIYDASSVFSRPIFAKNILIEQAIGDTSYVQNLLEYEYITCIAVDAADRKWVGTESAGVFLVSPTGTQQLFHFTTENSPLFSNRINDIKINPENGEVFIATADGLISYRGTATIGKENYKEVLVYPNPVREDYFGPIAVKGLMEDSFCKITDATGKLVWQGYAYGGQLIWNGKDFNGKRPATGVYFVMASSKTGKERKVAKFLFIQ